jgi:hypothetical protein
MVVEITVRRDDGTRVYEAVFNAATAYRCRTSLAGPVVDENGREWWGFWYTPASFPPEDAPPEPCAVVAAPASA